MMSSAVTPSHGKVESGARASAATNLAVSHTYHHKGIEDTTKRVTSETSMALKSTQQRKKPGAHPCIQQLDAAPYGFREKRTSMLFVLFMDPSLPPSALPSIHLLPPPSLRSGLSGIDAVSKYLDGAVWGTGHEDRAADGIPPKHHVLMGDRRKESGSGWPGG